MDRLAEPGEGITVEELRKATRNRGMPLEALALEITPVGLHYLLIHFDIPFVDEDSWSLRVAGNVESELDLSMEMLRSMPSVSLPVTLECAGNGRSLMEPRPIDQPWGLEAVSTSTWTGVPLWQVLDRAGMRSDTVDVVFTGADRGEATGVEDQYRFALNIAEAMRNDVILAFEMNGRPLEPQHGAPLRLLVPGWYGMASVKWITDITALKETFTGVQHDSYRYRQSEEDPGTPVTKLQVRSLMIPPGIPESFTRLRLVTAGRVDLRGRAWSGSPPIRDVEVGVDGTWHPAKLDRQPIGDWAWQGWSWEWNAEPGEHTLSCRATDAEGNIQPTERIWNQHGMGNNRIQEIPVTVR